MSHDPGADQFPQKIRRVYRVDHQPPDQKGKHQNHQGGAHQPGLLADNGKNHIVLGLRHKPQLLQAASQPPSENAAAADGVQSLDGLKPFLVGLRISPDGQPLQPVALQTEENSHERQPRRPDSHKRKVSGIGDENQDHADAKDNHRGTQIVGSHQPHNGQEHGHGPRHKPETVRPLFALADLAGQEYHHRHFGKFRRLEGQRSQRQPSFGAIVLPPHKQHQRGQQQGCAIDRPRQPGDPVIIHLGYQIQGQKSQCCGKQLFLKIIRRILKFHPSVVSAGAVQQHQSQHQQQKHKKQQRQIRPFPFRSCFHPVPPSTMVGGCPSSTYFSL